MIGSRGRAIEAGASTIGTIGRMFEQIDVNNNL